MPLAESSGTTHTAVGSGPGRSLLNLHCESMCLVADAMVISTAASVDWFLVY